MKRVIFTLVAAGSLILFCTFAFCTVRGYYYRDIVRFKLHGNQRVFLLSHRSTFWTGTWKGPTTFSTFETDTVAQGDSTGEYYARMPHVSFLGFHFHHPDNVQNYYIVIWPMWFLLLATAAPPAVWVVTTVRRRRLHVAGACRRCGYDLRATPDRCPECGLATVQSPA